jgi:hypothetical protein
LIFARRDQSDGFGLGLLVRSDPGEAFLIAVVQFRFGPTQRGEQVHIPGP